jgi:hypothetical protein
MPTPLLFSELGVSPLDHIPEKQRWTPRRVYYATTRLREDDLQRIDYGNTPATDISLGMTLIGFGTPQLRWSDLSEYSRQRTRENVVDLSIAGLVEIGRFQPATGGTPAIDETGSLAWLLSDMNRSIEGSRDQDLLIYVHGAKVNFYNASAFAAQLDHFMGRDMTSLAFSWPTRQNILAYGSGADVRRAYEAAPALRSLIEELAEGTVARRIHIVCWSAGGRVVTSALQQLVERHAASGDSLRERFRLGTIYYAAADVPESEFLTTLPALNALARRIVVTVSSNDGALNLASTLMGGAARGSGSGRTISTSRAWRSSTPRTASRWWMYPATGRVAALTSPGTATGLITPGRAPMWCSRCAAISSQRSGGWQPPATPCCGVSRRTTPSDCGRVAARGPARAQE